ncbi:hypothetical protein CMI42_05990 [Candidatus Pacearchaeota archaeon]|nr:hypothetical protein [Candidatus Pacearchaeota archaeon]|tara:strand:- start:1928 stop:2278 length:351 start_codon:yes stop_codon:yes gene_type:complete
MLKTKFLSDEDVDARLVKYLIKEGVDISYGEKGLNNSKLYSFACEENRAILTRDKDFLNTEFFSASNLPLILVLRIHPPELSKLKPKVLNFIKNLSEDKLRKTWELREEGAILVGT